jgi:hypothetical protein
LQAPYSRFTDDKIREFKQEINRIWSPAVAAVDPYSPGDPGRGRPSSHDRPCLVLKLVKSVVGRAFSIPQAAYLSTKMHNNPEFGAVAWTTVDNSIRNRTKAHFIHGVYYPATVIEEEQKEKKEEEKQKDPTFTWETVPYGSARNKDDWQEHINMDAETIVAVEATSAKDGFVFSVVAMAQKAVDLLSTITPEEFAQFNEEEKERKKIVVENFNKIQAEKKRLKEAEENGPTTSITQQPKKRRCKRRNTGTPGTIAALQAVQSTTLLPVPMLTPVAQGNSAAATTPAAPAPPAAVIATKSPASAGNVTLHANLPISKWVIPVSGPVKNPFVTPAPAAVLTTPVAVDLALIERTERLQSSYGWHRYQALQNVPGTLEAQPQSQSQPQSQQWPPKEDTKLPLLIPSNHCAAADGDALKFEDLVEYFGGDNARE